MSYVPMTFRRWIAVLEDDLEQNYDAVVCIDSTARNRHGPVGTGKSNLAYILAKAINPEDFVLRRDLVVRDDIQGFERNVSDRRPYKVVWVDEAEWFFFNQWWQLARVKALTPEFMSNRKERRIWIFDIPVIWGMVDFMRNFRIQWRLRMDSRTQVDVFMRHGIPSRKMEIKDLWGVYMGTVEQVPKVPDGAWLRYENLYLDHPIPCVKGRCVSMEPRRGYPT